MPKSAKSKYDKNSPYWKEQRAANKRARDEAKDAAAQADADRILEVGRRYGKEAGQAEFTNTVRRLLG